MFQITVQRLVCEFWKEKRGRLNNVGVRFSIYNFEISTDRNYAGLWDDLNEEGIQTGAHDLIIGSTARALEFSVATYNQRHIERIEGLKIESLTF